MQEMPHDTTFSLKTLLSIKTLKPLPIASGVQIFYLVFMKDILLVDEKYKLNKFLQKRNWLFAHIFSTVHGLTFNYCSC